MEVGAAPELAAGPRHPYTKILMESVYIADPLKKTNTPHIQGEVPSLFNIPEGCSFEDRCVYAKDICREKSPKLMEVQPGELVACHFPLSYAEDGTD